MYRNEKQLEKVKDMQMKMQQYETARQQMESNFEAVKFSKEADPGEIPLPDGLAIPGAAMTPALPSAIPAHLLLPDAPHKPGILKKAAPIRKGPKSDHPPGPPCGLPPEFSGSEDEEDEDGEPSDRRRRVRFGDESSDRRRQERELAPNEFDAGEGKCPISFFHQYNYLICYGFHDTFWISY
uniref:Uncharacterized protein n=1 Tax=Plectus sambesii TaxID=2011161 RepID=A0A914WDZ5_9BILA